MNVHIYVFRLSVTVKNRSQIFSLTAIQEVKVKSLEMYWNITENDDKELKCRGEVTEGK